VGWCTNRFEMTGSSRLHQLRCHQHLVLFFQPSKTYRDKLS
jgi:hypothetical protein